MTTSTRLFFKSLLISAVVSVLLLSAAALLFLPDTKDKTASENVSSLYSYTPKKEDRFSVLVTVSKSKHDLPYAYFLLGFDGVLNQISVTRLPPQTLLSSEPQKQLLGEVFKNSGVKAALKGLNDAFSLSLSHYVCFTNQSLLEFFEMFDSVVINVPQNLSQIDKQNDIYIKIDKGPTVLGSIGLIDYISCTAFDGGRKEALYESTKAICEFIDQNKPSLTAELLEKAIGFILDNADTDLTITDIENRRELLGYLLLSQTSKTVSVSPDGEFLLENTEYAPSSQFTLMLKKYF